MLTRLALGWRGRVAAAPGPGRSPLDWPAFSCSFEQDAYVCAGSYERDILTLDGDIEDEICLNSGY